MTYPSIKFASFLFAVIALSILVQLAESTATSFSVARGEEEVIILKLEAEDHVSVEFTAMGQGTENGLDFWITAPNQDIIVEFTSAHVDYSFVCDQAGDHTLHFSNRDGSEDKTVTLNYEIQHYIFGIPQMLFLAIIIVLVCVGAVATFTLMGKPR